jgi:hypothetical protein
MYHAVSLLVSFPWKIWKSLFVPIAFSQRSGEPPCLLFSHKDLVSSYDSRFITRVHALCFLYLLTCFKTRQSSTPYLFSDIQPRHTDSEM